MEIKAFKAIRPKKELASEIAALPYDVYSVKEAREIIKKNPKSFLQVDLPAATVDDEVKNLNEIALLNFNNLKKKGYFYKEDRDKLYIYSLTMKGKTQVGLVACASIDEYLEGKIKKHEFTRKDKEADRVDHVDKLDANTGPIFLTYKSLDEINKIIYSEIKEIPEIDFRTEDGVNHKIWTIEDEDTIEKLITLFKNVENFYIADGHHRCASAVKVGLKRREENKNYTGNEEFNYFLSLIFPSKEVEIMDYNRVVKDLNNFTEKEFLEKLRENFEVEVAKTSPYKPEGKGCFGMYLSDKWYKLKVKDELVKDDIIERLDVSILQNLVLDKILGIKNPRTDERIDFVGGIRGLYELEERTREDMQIAFSLYPTSLEELFEVADAGEVMPPKSTWFEPKPLSGLFIHELK
ncbi:DUF1015 domain-containing protein [Peptoniphilus porci]|uniref:SpoOJ/ParA/ParB/repB family protein n=1 Tax=Peptoniphilus porci TaxID=2652280 RepID=A0A1U7LZW8_9FIRM|nr:DUF1015 family protein [Peptoniphilus porci]OLR64934.1 hypothetical protein BIV18_05105 [Peptoniphilus porci]